jgi:hypothetical protein
MPDRKVFIETVGTVAAPSGANKRRPSRSGSPLREPPGPGLWLALFGCLGGCAATGSEIHLEPLYARIHTADGGTAHEAAGGLYRSWTSAEDGFTEWRTVAPLWGIDRERNGDYAAYHPFPLGLTNKRHDERFSMFVPLYLWSRKIDRFSGTMGWKLAMLPGLLMQQTEAAGFQMGLFPLIGRFRDFLTFDQLIFILWPLFVYSERAGRISYNIPWPILGWTYGNGERSHHLWPIYMKATIEGSYDRTTFLWPLFHFNKNYTVGNTDVPEETWMLWPLIGRKKRGSYRSTTLLWPLFGYASDPEEQYWALDAPFPLVRFERGEEVHRSRIWPFWSFTDADGLKTTSFLWPLMQFRQEDSPTYERGSTRLLPIWQSSTRTDKETGDKDRRRMFFPLFQYQTRGAWRQGNFPHFNPIERSGLFERFISRPLHVWEWEQEGDMRRERAWLGLYRREKGRGEDRRSVSFLWARRKFSEEGDEVKETSLLFGLLRWRTGKGQGFTFLPPAFPGPGWPEPAVEAERKGSERPRSYF